MWTVYILRCKDNSLYTGITKDLERRLMQHNNGKGAKYTRAKGPCTVEWFKEGFSESEAKKEECRIKKLSASDKKKHIICNKIMKKATCKDLRGACDAEILGETAEEMGANSKKHVMEMIQSGDEAHKAAVDSMMQLSKEDQMKWYEDFKSSFNTLQDA